MNDRSLKLGILAAAIPIIFGVTNAPSLPRNSKSPRSDASADPGRITYLGPPFSVARFSTKKILDGQLIRGMIPAVQLAQGQQFGMPDIFGAVFCE